jgi:transcription elongation GreA/GreB family factor
VNKETLLNLFKDLLKTNLQLAYDAAKNTYDIATHEENKAENKYDTRGLEASYLAGAQAERVADIKKTLTVFDTIKINNFTEQSKVALTALIELQSSEKALLLLLMPMGGGLTLNSEGRTIQVITPESPLGQNLVGKEIGDSVQIKDKEFEIVTLF